MMNTSLLYTLILIIAILAFFLLAILNSKKLPMEKKKELLDQLAEIKENLKQDNSSIFRDSIIRLDSVLSKALQLRFRNSLPCGENLKKAKSILKKREYENIWKYHRLRNSIVHENVDVRKDTAKKGFSVYFDVINKILG